MEEDPGKNNLGNRTGVAEVYSAKVRLELMHWRLSHGVCDNNTLAPREKYRILIDDMDGINID